MSALVVAVLVALVALVVLASASRARADEQAQSQDRARANLTRVAPPAQDVAQDVEELLMAWTWAPDPAAGLRDALDAVGIRLCGLSERMAERHHHRALAWWRRTRSRP